MSRFKQYMEIIQEMHPGLQEEVDKMNKKTLKWANSYRKQFSDEIFSKYKEIKDDNEKLKFQENVSAMLNLLTKNVVQKYGDKRIEVHMKEIPSDLLSGIKKLLNAMSLNSVGTHLQIANILSVFQVAGKEIIDHENSLSKKISDKFKTAVQTGEKIFSNIKDYFKIEK